MTNARAGQALPGRGNCPAAGLSCPRLPNHYRDLTSDFSDANSRIEEVRTPLIIAAGRRYFAQVLSPDICGPPALENLPVRIGDMLRQHLFADLAAARSWLREQA